MNNNVRSTLIHPAAPSVAANPTADRTYLATIGEFSQRAAKLSNDSEVSVAFSILDEALRRRAKQPPSAYYPEIGHEPFNASADDINQAWGLAASGETQGQ
jgi:hypothetical protein